MELINNKCKTLCNNDDCLQCFNRSFASHEKVLYLSKTNNVNPRLIPKFSHKKFIFDCDKCNHSFNIILSLVSNNSWCPYCSNSKLCENNDCIDCYEKSFASNEKSQYWSNENELLPRQIFKGSGKKYLFNCNICNHSFEKMIKHMNNLDGWCIYCANRKLCDNNNCNICFDKSLASHEKSQYFSAENDLLPREINKYSHDKYIFDCSECKHTFLLSPKHILRGVWCAYCSIPCKKICDNNDCNFCYNKSFASHPKSIYWSNKNEILPRQVIKYSNSKYYFECNICNKTFYSALSHICNKTWCPFCMNKTELKLLNWLNDNYNSIEIIHSIKFEWCKNEETNRFLPFDFLFNNKIIIELDGSQHFKQVRDWKSPEFHQERDIYKMKCALEKKYHIIRILQMDVFLDKNNWENNLKISIEEISKLDIPTVKCIGDENTYITYELLNN
jgi:very-short-patch-repair endonuclease